MEATIRALQENIYGSCGVGIHYGFNKSNKPRDRWGSWLGGAPINDTSDTYGGAGWTSAAFINTEVCEEAYKALKDKYKIVLQTPVRKNTNSGNDFFFVVYDHLKDKLSVNEWTEQVNKNNEQYEWPEMKAVNRDEEDDWSEDNYDDGEDL